MHGPIQDVRIANLVLWKFEKCHLKQMYPEILESLPDQEAAKTHYTSLTMSKSKNSSTCHSELASCTPSDLWRQKMRHFVIQQMKRNTTMQETLHQPHLSDPSFWKKSGGNFISCTKKSRISSGRRFRRWRMVGIGDLPPLEVWDWNWKFVIQKIHRNLKAYMLGALRSCESRRDWKFLLSACYVMTVTLHSNFDFKIQVQNSNSKSKFKIRIQTPTRDQIQVQISSPMTKTGNSLHSTFNFMAESGTMPRLESILRLRLCLKPCTRLIPLQIQV